MAGRTSRGCRAQQGDRGVSAVIGVILMVAITVAIAATVYIWVGGFGGTDGGQESASATAKLETYDGDSRSEWIKITLASGGDNAPYVNDSVSVEVVAGANVFDTACDKPETNSTVICVDHFGDASGETWDVGSSKYFPCRSEDQHSVTVAIQDQVVMDRTLRCQQVAT